MQFSERVKQMSPSLTIALATKAREMTAQGERICNLAAGEPAFQTPEVVVNAAIDALRAGATKYSAAGGVLELRQAVAIKYQRDNDLKFHHDEVVVGCGAKEILLHSLQAIISEGDEVLLTAPYWLSYVEHVKLAQGKPVVIPCNEEYKPVRVPDLEKYATPRTKAVIINNPNNPTGYVMTEDDMRELGDYLKTKDWWVISDEIYEYMIVSPEHQHYSLLNVCPELRERMIIVNGLSKGFSMTGWRVGYALGQKELIAHMKKLQSQATSCLPPFIERAATVALQHGKSLVQEEVVKIRDNCQLALKMVKEAGISCTLPNGAFYLFMRLPEAVLKKAGSALEFSQWLLENKKVMLVPSEPFGVEGHIRINYSVSRAELEKGVKLMLEGIEEFS